MRYMHHYLEEISLYPMRIIMKKFSKKYLKCGARGSLQNCFVLKLWKLLYKALEIAKRPLELKQNLLNFVTISCGVVRSVQWI